MAGAENLEDWLQEITKPKVGTISFQFPTDRLKAEYISSIEERSDDEVRSLLRRFLIPSGALGTDQFTLVWLLRLIKNKELPRLAEFQRRLLALAKASHSRKAVGPWEGITWVLDLLPRNPRAALDTLNAYLEVHAGFMPDGRIHGMFDSMEIIRAKYINRPRSSDDAVRLLLAESPRTLEHLVERLYRAMGYETALTPSQKDGGYDVLATRNESGQRARIHIECKRWDGNVGEPILRQLLGVLADSKATSGICVTTSDLTTPAKEFVERNPQLDFVPGVNLVQLLNEYLGSDWCFRIDSIVAESKEDQNRDEQVVSE